MAGVVIDGMQATHEELEQWGAWVRSSGVGGSVQSIHSVPRFDMFSITDGRAQLLDCAVAQLGRRDLIAAGAIRHYFVAERSYRDIGALLKISHSRARSIKDAGVAWIDGRLTDNAWLEKIEEKLGVY